MVEVVSIIFIITKLVIFDKLVDLVLGIEEQIVGDFTAKISRLALLRLLRFTTCSNAEDHHNGHNASKEFLHN